MSSAARTGVSVRVSARVLSDPSVQAGSYVYYKTTHTYYFVRDPTLPPERVDDILTHAEMFTALVVTNVPDIPPSKFIPSSVCGMAPIKTFHHFQSEVLARIPSNTGPTPCCITINFPYPANLAFSQPTNTNVDLQYTPAIKDYVCNAVLMHRKDSSKCMTFFLVNMHWICGAGHGIACIIDHLRKDVIVYDSNGYTPETPCQGAASYGLRHIFMEVCELESQGYKFQGIKESEVKFLILGSVSQDYKFKGIRETEANKFLFRNGASQVLLMTAGAQAHDTGKLRRPDGNCGFHASLYGMMRMLNPQNTHWQVVMRMFFIMRNDKEFISRFKQYVLLAANSSSKVKANNLYHSRNPRASMVTRGGCSC